MRFHVKFGWDVEADDMEDARLKAKQNLLPEGDRASTDTCDILREGEDPPQAELAEEARSFITVTCNGCSQSCGLCSIRPLKDSVEKNR